MDLGDLLTSFDDIEAPPQSTLPEPTRSRSNGRRKETESRAAAQTDAPSRPTYKARASRGKKRSAPVGGALESKENDGEESKRFHADAEGEQTRPVSETGRKAESILGAASRMSAMPIDEQVAKSSYVFSTVMTDVPQTLKTYRVQVDYGKRDRMSRGYSSYYMPLISNVDASVNERPAIYAMLPLLTYGTTAPQMPPPNINDPNMQFNWQHLIDEWPLRSKRPCSNCMHPFESIPWMIPVKRIEGYYKMDDSEHVFCSYPCMRRFLISSGYSDRFMYMVYANDIARNYFKWKGDLFAAPLRIWLETMSIEEYRSMLVPPPFFEFPYRDNSSSFDARVEAKWMSDMTMLRPPFLSGTAIMEWVQNVVPRAQQASKVLYDSSRPTVDAAAAADSSLLMGALVPDASEGRLTIEQLRQNKARFTPWRVEGLSVPDPARIEENEAHRIVLPPIDPEAPALIDEIIRMRQDVAYNRRPAFSDEARKASYVQEIDALRVKQTSKKQLDESDVLTQMIQASVYTSGRKSKSRKPVAE